MHCVLSQFFLLAKMWHGHPCPITNVHGENCLYFPSLWTRAQITLVEQEGQCLGHALASGIPHKLQFSLTCVGRKKKKKATRFDPFQPPYQTAPSFFPCHLTSPEASSGTVSSVYEWAAFSSRRRLPSWDWVNEEALWILKSRNMSEWEKPMSAVCQSLQNAALLPKSGKRVAFGVCATICVKKLLQ